MIGLKKIVFLRNLFIAVAVFVFFGLMISPQAIAIRVEESNPVVSFSGDWTLCSDPPCTASGGTLKYSGDLQPPAASCSFTFEGYSISWIGFKQYNMGISEVWIDGIKVADVDLYAPGTPEAPDTLWDQVLFTKNGLSCGEHTITIRPTDQQNTTSKGYFTNVDAFDVVDGFYWKDYNGDAPGGYMPDIDQKQDFDNDGNAESHYCSPVAEANSLWWLDKAHHLGIFSDPENGVGYFCNPVCKDINNDGKSDILDLVQDLAVLMKTSKITGTQVTGEQTGIETFLQKYGLYQSLYEHVVTDQTVPESSPDLFAYIVSEVRRSQDVKLDLGFWRVVKILSPGFNDDGDVDTDEDPINGKDDDLDGKKDEDPPTYGVVWKRDGGHSVTVAGGDCDTHQIAISDPYYDAKEVGAPGVVRPENGHPVHPGNPTVHNNEANASHDIYTVVPSVSPGGKWALQNYPLTPFPADFYENNGPATQVTLALSQAPAFHENDIFAEIEAAVIVSPASSPITLPTTVLSPNGGEVLGSGKRWLITWSSSPEVAQFDLWYSLNNGNIGTWRPIANGLSGGSGPGKSYDWKLPAVVGNQLNCVVKVKGYDASGMKVSEDKSDRKFTIEVLRVTSPAAGDELISGSIWPIRWLTNKTAAVVTSTEIYGKCQGQPYTLLSTRPGNPGYWDWTVLNVMSVKMCKIAVVLKNNGTKLAQDEGDIFEILPAP